MASMTLYYFDFPGRAEAARIMLTMAKKEFTYKGIQNSEWLEWKAKMPFGQVPVLEVDGKMLAQMAAIDRYVASLTGLLPSDPWKLAWGEQAYFFMNDLWEPIGKAVTVTYSDATEEAKDKAAKELMDPEGTFITRMGLLERFVANRENKYLAGDSLSYIDLAIYVNLSVFQSGFIRGMPRDILTQYPTLKEFRNMIASLPEVAACFTTATDEMRRNSFPPDAEAPAAPA